MKKILCICISIILISPSFIDDLNVTEKEKVGKPGFFSELLSGQFFIDMLYGDKKVSVDIWDEDLTISSVQAGYQQINVKINKNSIQKLNSDFPDTEVEYLYNTTSYSYISLEMRKDNIAQKFWSTILNNKVTLADKDYVEKISLNRQLSLVKPQDYADKNSIARTTYELCKDYNILDTGYTGNNISVAVLDTGIRWTHDGFRNTTIYNETKVIDESPNDLNGHGTHVSGILAGSNVTLAETRMRGVAPNVTLHSIKVLDSEGRGTEDAIVKGIQSAIDNSVDIVSMSLGGRISYNSVLHDVIQYAVGKGIVVVAAAGNSASVTSAQPASWEGVISVEALSEDKHIAPYTCLYGDVMAEGTNITSLNYHDSDGALTLSGTSMATPFVSGCIALLLEAQPTLRGRPIQVTKYLKSTGSPVPKTQTEDLIARMFTPANYRYDTRDININNLLKLKELETDRQKISDIGTQMFRNRGI
ncbi:MAG: S8 family serine peptidase [Bacteroides sp.]|uniref:S8 family peptidase n=1 Tax=Bacteroides sp. TaxID=29523 RepID=UPI002FC3CDD2